MGRYTLLLVLAAVAGGSYLTLNALQARNETGGRRADAQASTVARQLAESGQAIGLTAVTGPDGFDRAGGGVFNGERPYRGGTISFDALDYVPLDRGRQRVAMRVSGAYGGAVHRLRSVYEFDPMDFPGPIWLDVPYAAARIDRKATIAGDAVASAPQIDPAKNDDLGLAADGLSLAAAKSSFAAAGAAVPVWNGPGDDDGYGRTADLGGARTADDLYFQVTNAIDTAPGSADRVIAGPLTVSSPQTMGAPDAITQVQGPLTVRGRLEGSGALVVEGDLTVTGKLDWDGMVIVRSEAQHVAVDLPGEVTITGALVVSQEAYPPGGHIDLTVFRSPAGGWVAPWGRRESGPGALRGSSWPLGEAYRWLEHTHRFDLPTDGDADRLEGRVRFYDAGGDVHGRYTGLGELLRELGSKEVRVEFVHTGDAHGHAVYELDVAGRDGAAGTVARGFGGTTVAGPSAYKSDAFQARDLRKLTVRPRARRSLKKLWDGPGACPGDEWPYCVGERRDRAGALTVRLVDAADGRVYYEGALYWHQQDGPERAEHEARVAAWRAGVTSGATPFGTTLTMGPKAGVTYAGAPIVALAGKVGFDGNEVLHISTESDLTEAVETRAAAATDPTAPSPTGQVLMCDKTRKRTKYVADGDLQKHLGHGCTVGACPTTDVYTDPSRPPTERCPRGEQWEWDDGRWECD